jgi:DNA-binding NtrC family response regulator
VRAKDQGLVERQPELLVADLDQVVRSVCARLAETLECGVLFAADTQRILHLAKSHQIGTVLIDTVTIPEYLETTEELKKESARIQVIITSQRSSIPDAVAAIKAGALDYLEKPLTDAALENALSEAVTQHRNFKTSVVPLEELERQAIEEALAQAQGNKIEAARLLSIGKTTLYRKLREYRLENEIAQTAPPTE